MSRRKNAEAPDTSNLLNQADRYEQQGDFRKAFKCYLEGAKLGDSGCQIGVGNYYAWGKGAKRSLEQAAYWYKRAYRNGESTGALNLAIDRRDSGNIRSAIVWLKKAVAMNDGSACVQLAKIYTKRRNGNKAAIALLKRVLPMSVNYASELDKEEASSLLKTIIGSGVQEHGRRQLARRSLRSRR